MQTNNALIRLSVVIAMAASMASAPAHGQDTRLSTAVAHLEWREIGPAIMGGRISDLAVVESRPATFYVGTASGGVWKTTNDGASWEPIFDDQTTASIGDVTVAASNQNIVWVGTGEPQNRQSSPWGDGVFKSTDGGRSWVNMGLRETRHISRIVIHPSNPDVVYVAAVGHLWGPNLERGVYKTTDGGENWELVLFVDENTGAIDLAIDPGDPQTLFAAMYQRRRTGFGFNGGGPGSGIYRTADGGKSWQELTNGLPEGNKGRIGIDVYRRDGNILFAVVEAERRGFGAGAPDGPRRPRRGGVYKSTDRGETWEQMSETTPRPMYYSQVRIDPNDPERIYLGGTQLMVSEDGGKTFRSDGAPRIHVDHHALWINPHDSDNLILGSDGGVSTSRDRGKTWRMYDNLAIGQFYRVGVDMREPYYVCGGLQDNSSWCGPSQTLTTYGIRNRDWYDVWGGDGFHNVIDPTDHTIMFSSSQGGNLGRVDVTTGERVRLRPVARPVPDDDDRSYRWNWDAPIVMSTHNPATIYVGANVLLRSTDRGVKWEEASPDLTKQIDRSELEIMGVLPTDDMLSRHDGISSYGNITAVAESPINGDVLYVGTDDGNLQATRDGGATWENVVARVDGVPERTYVSRVVASRFAEGRVYATFDGHRNDDFRPYVFVSDDYGQRWRPISRGLPDWSVNVIVEHHRNPDLLFLGNEIGVYYSIDRGDQWTRLKNNLPTVPVDDIVVHQRENDLVLGTHGRSIWILGDITPLEQLSGDVIASSAHLFPVRPATMYSLAGGWPFTAHRYEAPNPPAGALIRYYLREPLAAADAVAADAPRSADNGGPRRNGDGGRGDNPGSEAKITILDAAGDLVRELEGSGEAGIQQVVWDFRLSPPYEPREGTPAGGGGGGGFGGPPQGPRVLPGTYTVRFEAGGQSLTGDVVVRADPRIQISRADLMARQAALISLYRLSKPTYDATQSVRRLSQQVADIQDLVRDNDDARESLAAEVDSLRSDLTQLSEEIAEANRDTRLSGAIESATARPTEDQLWQIERAWERVPQLIDRVNRVITGQLPAIYRQLDEYGIRPDPGTAVTIPRRPSR